MRVEYIFGFWCLLALLVREELYELCSEYISGDFEI